jgi:hypothetical protein
MVHPYHIKSQFYPPLFINLAIRTVKYLIQTPSEQGHNYKPTVNNQNIKLSRFLSKTNRPDYTNIMKHFAPPI